MRYDLSLDDLSRHLGEPRSFQQTITDSEEPSEFAEWACGCEAVRDPVGEQFGLARECSRHATLRERIRGELRRRELPPTG